MLSWEESCKPPGFTRSAASQATLGGGLILGQLMKSLNSISGVNVTAIDDSLEGRVVTGNKQHSNSFLECSRQTNSCDKSFQPCCFAKIGVAYGNVRETRRE